MAKAMLLLMDDQVLYDLIEVLEKLDDEGGINRAIFSLGKLTHVLNDIISDGVSVDQACDHREAQEFLMPDLSDYVDKILTMLYDRVTERGYKLQSVYMLSPDGTIILEATNNDTNVK